MADEIANKIFIYNSLSGKKEEFIPINKNLVGMYVCGPTVYSNVHLGNCRTFLTFDMVYRYLKHIGYQVRYVRNITDAGHLENDADEGEDKIAKKARIEQLEPMEIVQAYTVDFHNVMRSFNALPPSIEPTATGHIIEQIEMIRTIMDKGLAYEVNGSVYFDVKKYSEKNNYGELSGRKLDELREGTRELDGQSEKKDPIDFALWKKASDQHIMRWQSPWSDGFPGWHLECSVMSSKYLGDQFDIHGGGMDLKFPHHECEIAQGKASNETSPVNYWMHGNMLTLNGKRMSKSTGNTLLPHELFSGENELLEKAYHPMVVRFFMMQAHYRSTLDFSSEALSASEKGYQKLMAAIETLDKLSFTQNEFNEAEDTAIVGLCEQCFAFMNDDFNTPRTIATLFELVSKINVYAKKGSIDNISEKTSNLLSETFRGMVFDVLGLKDIQDRKQGPIDGVMDILINLRKEAKLSRNFELSDKIRDELSAAGIQLKDSRDGTTDYTIN